MIIPPLLRRLLVVGLLLPAGAGLAQTADAPWLYRLLADSTLLDDCPICGRPSRPFPARGTFGLVQVSAGGTRQEYALTNIALQSTLFGGEPVDITGSGELVVDPAQGAQAMQLRLRFSHSASNYVFTLDTNQPPPGGRWPVFQVSLVETQSATGLQTFYLNLLAAPVRELWFSTVHGMTRGDPGLPRVEGDDYVTDSGGVLRRGADLLRGAGLPPGELPGLVDAIQPGPDGEVLFSLVKDGTSSQLGAVQHGDVLSERGRRVWENQALTQELGFMPPVPDLGLDALQVQPDGRVLFSITTTQFSERLGVMLGPGDLLANDGQRVRAATDLVAAFKPALAQDFGLDAFFVWPSGEIWFSTETGFDAVSGFVGSGDLLSDQGYVVYKNLDLVRAFSPLEDLADFGLDAVWVVSDSAAAPGAPRLTDIQVVSDPPALRIQWTGPGTVFQLEKAVEVTGPFVPAGPVQPSAEQLEPLPASSSERVFYRVRQW